MRPITVQAGPFAAANAANIVASTTPVSGTPLTIIGGSPFVMDTPRRVVVTAGSEAAPRTLTVVGTDRNGVQRTEVINIPATTAGTYGSALDYATIISLTPGGGGWTAAATVGTIATSSAGAPAVASSAWVRFDDYGFAPVAVEGEVTLAGGTITYSVETSMDDPNLVAPQTPVPPQSMVWVADPNISGATATKQDTLIARTLWARVTVTAYTGNAFVAGIFSQAGGKGG